MSATAPSSARRTGRARIRAIVVTGVLLASCGGVSSAGPTAASGASGRSLSAAPRARIADVTASSGAFGTVVPSGFRNRTAALSGGVVNIEYAAVRPSVDGFATNINVVRERTPSNDIVAATAAEMAANDASLPQGPLVLEAQDACGRRGPARAVDYLNAPTGGRLRHQRQVFVIHLGWVHEITCAALPGAAYSGSLPALHQVIAGWH
jgi:hypothetical protein